MVSGSRMIPLAAALVGMLFINNDVSADSYWNSSSAACVPVDNSIQNDTYDIDSAGGTVLPKGSSNFWMHCPVSNHLADDDYHLGLFYQDEDGSASANQITAYLMSWTKSTGSWSNICSAASDSTGTWEEVSASCGNVDVTSRIYWVRIVVATDGNKTLEFYGVDLTPSV